MGLSFAVLFYFLRNAPSGGTSSLAFLPRNVRPLAEQIKLRVLQSSPTLGHNFIPGLAANFRRA